MGVKLYHYLIYMMSAILCLWGSLGCDDDDGIIDPGDASSFLFANASPGGVTVDVLVDNDVVVSDLAFPNNTDYIEVEDGTRNLQIRLNGTDTTIVDTTVVVAANGDHSIFLADTGAAMSVLIVEDDLSDPAGDNAKVRFINLTPDAPAVDVATVDTTDTDTTATSDTTVVFQDVAFKEATDFVSLASGTYDFQVRLANGIDTILEIDVSLESGNIVTIFTRGFLNGTGLQQYDSEVIINKE